MVTVSVDSADANITDTTTKYMDLLSTERQTRINEYLQRRNVSITSQMSAISVASSSASDFLEERIIQMTSEKERLRVYKEGLFEAKNASLLDLKSFQEELDSIVGAIHPLSINLRILLKQKRAIEMDIEEEVANTKRDRDVEPDISRTNFWPTPGKYLERSTLRSLARNISGLELPPSLINDQTFEDKSISEAEADDVGVTLADDLRRATIESIKELERRPEDDDDQDEDG
ncbi:hypothetical protein BDW59DRAFT_157757 [Aspergillus cavernicola]|uniref:Uncharacterized protein n=1 Tax=Aspergillus cavernicola TaxID=176166 RepID=A0ABR4IVL6_9EURO